MAPERRICLMNDSFPPVIDGVANAVLNYAAYIRQNYGESVVVTPSHPEAHDEDFPFPVIRYPSLDTTSRLGYRAGLPFSPETLQKLEEQRFHLIHSHCPIVSTLLARTLRQRREIPVVFTYHTKFDIDIANAIRARFLQEEAIHLLVENIQACDEVWVVSRGAGENLRSLGYQGEWRVMPNGVDFPCGRVPEASVAAATAGYDLPEGTPVFLFVGRLMWYKGLRILLDALKELEKRGQDFRMVFVGGGGDEAEIRAYVSELALEGRCFFTGPLYDRDVLRAWYCRADLFLFPATFDTNGLVVREAAACALPSLLVAGSCAAEDVEDGETGFLMEENAASMASVLLPLCAAPERMRAVGRQAQRRLYLSWEDAVAHACERYEEVLREFPGAVAREQRAPSEGFFHGVAQALVAINRARALGQDVQRELESSREELNAELEEERRRLQGKLENLWQQLERFL